MAIGTPVAAGSVLVSNNTTSAAITGINASVGDLVIVASGDDGDDSSVPGAADISDSAVNGYQADTLPLRGGTANGTDHAVVRVFSSVIKTALVSGTITVRFPISGAANWDKWVVVTKVSGNWDANRVDQISADRGTGTAWSSGALADTHVANELFYGVAAGRPTSASGTATPTAPNSLLFDFSPSVFVQVAVVYQILSSVGNPVANGSWTNTQDGWATAAISYKEATSDVPQDMHLKPIRKHVGR